MASEITSISPGVGGINKLVTIGGTGFGASRSHSKVVLQKDLVEIVIDDADVISWADDEIEFYVPEEIINIGNWSVKVRVVNNA